MRARGLAGLVAAGALAAGGAAAPGAGAAEGQWLAGDLHVHTVYSHDSYGGPSDDNTGPEDFYTAGYRVPESFALAASRGLHYLAITDHNDVRSQRDPGFGSSGVLGIPGYENSLEGHAQMLGARRVYDNGDKKDAAVRRLISELHADGGALQANHPTEPEWKYPYDVPVDTVEVWNLPWYYQQPFPATADNDKALRYWMTWLDRGLKVTATGGSDSHWVSTSSLQGVGQPTTWVFARDRTVQGVLDGIRAGRTYVSHEPPNLGGPGVFLEGDADRNGSFESMVGDTVPPGTPLRVRVTGALGASLRIAMDGNREAGPVAAVASGTFEHRFTAPSAATWVHAEVFGQDAQEQRPATCTLVLGADVTKAITYCTNRIVMMALSSALYLRVGAPSEPEAARNLARAAARNLARASGVRSRCARTPFRASVSGLGVTRVAFALDGRRLAVVRRPDGRGRFRATVDPRRLRAGTHRLRARVTFSGAAARTLTRRVRVCARAAAVHARPRFTG